jgi:hypothetical protein
LGVRRLSTFRTNAPLPLARVSGGGSVIAATISASDTNLSASPISAERVIQALGGVDVVVFEVHRVERLVASIEARFLKIAFDHLPLGDPVELSG